MKIEVSQNGKVILSQELQDGSYRIGRAADCDILLDSPKVSKHHALLVIKGKRAAILDTESSNGTFVNGILIKKQILNIDDLVEIGGFSLKSAGKLEKRKNARLESAQGSAALKMEDPELGFAPESIEVDRQTQLQNSGSASDFQRSTQERLAELVEKKLLLPFYEVAKRTDYRFLMATILMVTISGAAFFSVTPLISWGLEVNRVESLKRGHVILKQIVRENYRILSKSNDTSLLSVAAGEADKDMQEVYILDSKTKSVLAPTKYLSKSINDPYVLLALEDVLEKGQTESTKDRGDGNYVLVESIPYYGPTDLTPTSEANSDTLATPAALVVGYFKVPRNIIGIYEPLAVSGLISLLLALSAFFFLFKLVSRPVSKVGEQLDAALKGEEVEVGCEVKFPELETLVTVINFALSRLKSVDGAIKDSPIMTSQGGDASGSEEEQCLKIIEGVCAGSSDGILVLDRDKKIKYVSPVLADLLSLRPQYALGQNISDACRDGSFAGTVIDMCEKVITSLGENQTASLEINGVARNLVAVGQRFSNAEIGFVVLTVRMNG